ncbi:MAG: hypothetical protein ABI208_02820 [Ginsengibacter sp.]|jgi:hypothetical protein
MRKWLILFFITVAFNANAQISSKTNKEQNSPKGFQKDRLFTGGNVIVAFSNRYTVLGLSPQFGYSLTNWLDAGISFNFNYTSQRDYSTYGDKLRETVYGPGAFVRIFPVNFLFGTAQFEYNTIRQKYISATSGTPDQIDWVSAPSLLVGGGYSGGRENGGNSYYYISVMWDVAGDVNSPYTDGYNRSNPIIRAGYNIGLFQGKKKRY